MQGVHLRKYGVAATIPFELYEVDGVDFRVDAVHAAGDSTRVKDGGAEQNTTNGFVDEGKSYSITLTAGEMQAAEIVVHIVDQTATKVWLDKAIIVETYGHAAAMHAMDFNDAVRGGMTALPNAAADAAGGLPISDAGGLDLDDMKTKTDGLNFDGNNVLCDVMAMNTGVITSINFSTGALAADAFAANSLDGKGNWNTVVPDAAGTAPTSAEIKTAIEAGGSSLAQILVDTGTTLPASLPAALTKGTADSGTTTTMVDAARTEADTDYWKDSLIRFTSGTISGQTRLVTGFTPASDTITFFPAVTQAVATNTYEILPAAFGNILADWVDGGRLDSLLDAIPTTAMRGTDSASTHDAAAVKTALEADGAKLDHLWEMTEDDAGVRRLTINALEQAPSAGTNPNVLINTTAATVPSQTSFTLAAGSNDNDAYNDQAIVIYDASESDYPSVRKVSAYTGATKTVTLDSAPDFTMIVGDGVKIFVTAPGTTAPTVAQVADAVWDEATAGHTVAGSTGVALTDGSSLTVLPLQASADGSGRLSPNYLTAYQYTQIEAVLSILDANKDPVDLSGLTLAFVAWLKDTPETTAITMRTDGPSPELTIGGDDNNQVTIDGGTAHTATTNQYDWVLYDLGNERALAAGTLNVEEGAAMPAI
ncbi:hypothetical protein LCGC14_1454230 [marine sediment metagenome]|uniref:Uncharacterized protein n=1 Tax=marine sediment metagenome TaxID=412755 RepID=A0A0F9LXH9_9ZZZZ